jgi:hypothetical protein
LNLGTLSSVGASGNDFTATTQTLTGAAQNLEMLVTNTGTGGYAHLVLKQQNTNAADADPAVLFIVGLDASTTHAWIQGADNSVSEKMVWASGTSIGTNDRMRLTTAGVLSVDGDGGGSDDPVSLFDELDDAMEIRRFQLAIPQAPISPAERQANRDRMVEIGVGEWAVQEDGSHRYMDRVQPLSRFLAGGIYQNRERMDAQYEAMDERLNRIEQALGV